MAPYFWLLLIPCIFAVFHQRRTDFLLLTLTFLFFVFFVGFRYKVGMDWNNYEYIHMNILNKDLYDLVIRSEPFSFILFWISSYLEQGSLITNIVAAILLMFGVFSFALTTQNPWLSIIAATPYLIIAFGMTGIRQAMAIGIILFMFSLWGNISLLRRAFFIILASLFHMSAIVVAVVFLIDDNITFSRKVMLGMVMLPVTYFSLMSSSYTGSLEFYQETYLGEKESVVSPGALLHIALVLGPALLFLLFRRKMRKITQNYELLMFGSLIALLMVPMYLVSTTGASRLILYVYFVPMMVYPAIPSLFARRHKPVITLGICLMHFGILTAWLLYANNSSAHTPYQNILFYNTI